MSNNKKKEKKVFGKDYIFETRDVDITVQVVRPIPGMNSEMFKIGAKLDVVRFVYKRVLDDDGDSFVFLVTVYLKNGEAISLTDYYEDLQLDWSHYFEVYQEPNSVNFIKEN